MRRLWNGGLGALECGAPLASVGRGLGSLARHPVMPWVESEGPGESWNRQPPYGQLVNNGPKVGCDGSHVFMGTGA